MYTSPETMRLLTDEEELTDEEAAVLRRTGQVEYHYTIYPKKAL